MSRIVWDQFLEKRGLLVCVQIVECGPNSFIFSESDPLPPDALGIRPREFWTRDEATKWVEGDYIPGRRAQGWKLKELTES